MAIFNFLGKEVYAAEVYLWWECQNFGSKQHGCTCNL